MKAIIVTASIVAMYLVAAGAMYHYKLPAEMAKLEEKCATTSKEPLDPEVAKELRYTTLHQMCMSRNRTGDAAFSAIFWPLVLPIDAGKALVR